VSLDRSSQDGVLFGNKKEKLVLNRDKNGEG